MTGLHAKFKTVKVSLLKIKVSFFLHEQIITPESCLYVIRNLNQESGLFMIVRDSDVKRSTDFVTSHSRPLSNDSA